MRRDQFGSTYLYKGEEDTSDDSKQISRRQYQGSIRGRQGGRDIVSVCVLCS